MPMAGTKRPAAGDLSPRPWKVRRLGSGSADVTCAVGRTLQQTDKENGDGAADGSLVFINATAEAVSAFDWSDVIGALDISEAVATQLAADGDLLVNVPGAARHVPISKRVLLKEIVSHLGLKVFSYGIVMESKDLARGWIDMEILSCSVSGVKGRKKFFSDEELDKYAAMEGACGEAISYLHKTCFVLVHDVNYEEVRALQKRALAAETWSTLLNDVLDAGRKNQKAIREAYTSFFIEAKRLCTNFSDVFPGGSISTVSSSLAPDDGKIYYGGPRPPVSRAEQFAYGLVDLINISSDVGLFDDDVV